MALSTLKVLELASFTPYAMTYVVLCPGHPFTPHLQLQYHLASETSLFNVGVEEALLSHSRDLASSQYGMCWSCSHFLVPQFWETGSSYMPEIKPYIPVIGTELQTSYTGQLSSSYTRTWKGLPYSCQIPPDILLWTFLSPPASAHASL